MCQVVADASAIPVRYYMCCSIVLFLLGHNCLLERRGQVNNRTADGGRVAAAPVRSIFQPYGFAAEYKGCTSSGKGSTPPRPHLDGPRGVAGLPPVLGKPHTTGRARGFLLFFERYVSVGGQTTRFGAHSGIVRKDAKAAM